MFAYLPALVQSSLMQLDLAASAHWLLSSVSLLPLVLGVAIGQQEATPAAIRAFFAGKKMKVLTFFGYSGAGYEDPAAMRATASRILDEVDPKTTIVNIGATAEGIGVVYEIAKRKGFVTTGIVSTQARDLKVPLSPHVDVTFFVEDETWGGFLPGSIEPSPTSKAMVENSDILIAIGGGDVVRDELSYARRLGKKVRFIPADMNHAAASKKAAEKGAPAPTSFGGSAASAFASEDRR